MHFLYGYPTSRRPAPHPCGPQAKSMYPSVFCHRPVVWRVDRRSTTLPTRADGGLFPPEWLFVMPDHQLLTPTVTIIQPCDNYVGSPILICYFQANRWSRFLPHRGGEVSVMFPWGIIICPVGGTCLLACFDSSILNSVEGPSVVALITSLLSRERVKVAALAISSRQHCVITKA